MNWKSTLPRRDFVRVGGLTALGLASCDLSPDGWATDESATDDSARRVANGGNRGQTARAKSCILIWLDGGPSHIDTFDPKPDAPAEIRGPFATIATGTPGIRFSEMLAKTAGISDRLAIIRSMTSPLGEHGLANHYLLTGYHPSPVLQYPAYGAVVSQQRQATRNSVLPPYVAVPESRSMGAGYLGAQHDPFITGGDPAKPDFQVRDLNFFQDVDLSRIKRRRDFLTAFDTDDRYQRAYGLITSTEAKSAFHLTSEPEQVRARYGPRTFGQSCLLARRLVERGVDLVTVTSTGWDTHGQLSLQLRDGFAGATAGVGLVPTFDQGFSALIQDLEQRGMLAETLVVVMGEFGRTPKINTQSGRDHWPRVFSAVIAGGSVPGGQVIGASDRVGESPKDDPITPSDLAFTIYQLLGIDPKALLVTPDGRPVAINQTGTAIKQLT